MCGYVVEVTINSYIPASRAGCWKESDHVTTICILIRDAVASAYVLFPWGNKRGEAVAVVLHVIRTNSNSVAIAGKPKINAAALSHTTAIVSIPGTHCFAARRFMFSGCDAASSA